jgi:hypothetical protein
VIRTLLNATGGLRVQSDGIEVHLEQLSASRYTLAMQSLYQPLNAMSPDFPRPPTASASSSNRTRSGNAVKHFLTRKNAYELG